MVFAGTFWFPIPQPAACHGSALIWLNVASDVGITRFLLNPNPTQGRSALAGAGNPLLH